MRDRHPILHWLERLLLCVGVVLACWSAYVLVEARRSAHMPIPPPLTVTQTLPGRSLPGDGPSPRATPPSTGAWVARLEAPTVQMSATVLEGSDDKTLRRGAGHLEDTPMPGQPGNIGIAGHRDTVFRPLRNIRIGDPLQLTTADRTYRYRIIHTLIV